MPPKTPTITFLQKQPGTFRIAPFFPYLFPNACEMVGLEDIRGHFMMPQQYRHLMHRIDPSSADQPTLVLFNSLHFDFNDPLVGFLNVRYFIEQPSIDIIRWSIDGATTPVAPARDELPLRSGETVSRAIPVDADRFYAVAFTFRTARSVAPESSITVRVKRSTGEIVEEESYTSEELATRSRFYAAVWPHARRGEVLLLSISSDGVWGTVASSDPAPGVETPIAYGRVTTPVMLAHLFPDGRVFRNVAESPRFFPVWNLKVVTEGELASRKDIDLATVATLDEPAGELARRLGGVPRERRHAGVAVSPYRSGAQGIVTDSSDPFLLASSEKLTSELRITIDGHQIAPVRINSLFAGVPVERGHHVIRFVRRIGRGWWPVSAAAFVVFIIIAVVEPSRRRAIDPHGEFR
jgi:hypothetical protein